VSDRRAIVEAVATRALDYPYKVWGFGEGMALLGLIRAGALLGRPQWIDAVADLVAPSLARPPDPTDHLIPVDMLRELARHRPLPVAAAIARFTGAVVGAHRPVPGRPPVHRPDLPGLSSLIWVDCLHTDGPGLPHEMGTPVVEECAAVLQDATGLFSHGYDVATGRANGVHWGRGQGWALHGLTAVASADRLHSLLEALRDNEIDGSWLTIVDDPSAPIEHSVSALVAACPAVAPAMRRRALAAALDAIDSGGGLPVSAATPVGPPATYLDRDTGLFPWGQGPLLLALLLEES
jgi:unsaturated rhamnogalacturonyl hydrolase